MAAELAMSGVNPMEFLECKDPGKLAVWQLIAAATKTIREREQHNLAVRIVNGVGELFGGKQ